LTAAHAQGVSIIVKEAMANGRVLSNAALLKHAAELDCSPDALALACVLAQPFEPHVLSGAVTADQVAMNLGAIAVAERLRGDPELLGRIMDETRQESEAYWAERAALAWN
jgi:aryl-alcohol dehydrogenase-like predicted oxidoreductase